MKIIGIVVSIITGALLLMALAACIAVVRAEECMRAIEEMIEEYRTSWLSYSEISQLATSWREKMEEWEKLKSVDIRTINRDGLIDVTRIPEDDSDDVDKEMQMRTFLRNVKNPYCFMVGDVIVKSSFTEGVSLKQRLRELEYRMKIAIKVWKKGKFCANICIGLNE